MDKNSIKNLLSQTFVNEAKVPGLDVTNKAKGESGKENKKAIKDMESELSNYDKESKKQPKDATKPVKFNYTDDSEAEYHQEMEIMNGQEMIQYDRTPSEKFKKRAEDAIAGAAYMGNSPDWANVVIPGQGGDPTFGKKLVKAIKASEKKRTDNTPTSKMFGDDWEITQDKSHKDYAFENKQNNKSTIKESTKMKRLTFKKPFNGINNALNLIPEAYRVDNKVFEMTDGNESYRVRWEGSLNEGKGVVLMASDKSLVNEDIQKMKHLMGYKSQDTFGNLKGAERLNEDRNFGDIWRKSKTMLTEGMDEWSEKQLAAFDKDGNGIPFEKKDMAALHKEGSMYEAGMYEMDDMSRDAQRLDTLLDKNSALAAAISKINTKEELIDTMSMMYGDILKNNPQLASSEMELISALKDVSRQSKSQPEMGMAEGGMYEGDDLPAAPGEERPGGMFYEDRFEEVFSGLDEDMNEGMLNEGKFSNLFSKAKEVADKVFNEKIKANIDSPDENKRLEAEQALNDVMKAYNITLSKIGNPKAILSNLIGAKPTPEEEAELIKLNAQAEGQGQVTESIFGDSFKYFLAKYSAIGGAPAALLTAAANVWANVGGWNWSKILTYLHDVTHSLFGRGAGPMSFLLFLISLVYLMFSCIAFLNMRDERKKMNR